MAAEVFELGDEARHEVLRSGPVRDRVLAAITEFLDHYRA
jgi:hypothetical protein